MTVGKRDRASPLMRRKAACRLNAHRSFFMTAGIIRDRDAAYGTIFSDRLATMNIVDVPTAPRSPWQNAYVERVIGSIRRECLDHVIVLNARHLRQTLSSYFAYYHGSRTHLSLGKDTPDRRSVRPTGSGKIVAFPRVGGLHHRYERLAA